MIDALWAVAWWVAGFILGYSAGMKKVLRGLRDAG